MQQLSQTEREKGYFFYLVNIDCMRSSVRFNTVMELDESIEELLPYLASQLPGCTYLHGSGVINVMDSGHIVAIYPKKITITDIGNTQEAADYCRKYFKLIEHVKTHKDKITPVYEKRTDLTVLDIFYVLPRTNCGECGNPTCMAFAARVFRRETSILSCRPLLKEDHKHREFFKKLEEHGYHIEPEANPTTMVNYVG